MKTLSLWRTPGRSLLGVCPVLALCRVAQGRGSGGELIPEKTCAGLSHSGRRRGIEEWTVVPREAVMAGPEPKLRELFSKAAECQTTEEQAAFLNQACQGNAELRAQLEELLQLIATLDRSF